ncbi:hypothetical protein A7975_31390 [Bacillus sp. FJAT-26390]|nr:hypothetical protein A7975_31390 [Bacillus sp. FJAT-26390]
MLSFSTGCTSEKNATLERSEPQSYLEQKGYYIVSNEGIVYSYELTKQKIIELPYMIYWGLQSADPSDYFGKTIQVQKFIVTNHPLSKEKVDVYVYVADHKPIGGTSHPHGDASDGGYWSIDGKTLEELQDQPFQEWREHWVEKYTNTTQN